MDLYFNTSLEQPKCHIASRSEHHTYYILHSTYPLICPNLVVGVYGLVSQRHGMGACWSDRT